MDCCQSAACRTPKIPHNPPFRSFFPTGALFGGVEFTGGYDGRLCKMSRPAGFPLREEPPLGPRSRNQGPLRAAPSGSMTSELGLLRAVLAGRYGGGIIIAPEYKPAAKVSRSRGAQGARERVTSYVFRVPSRQPSAKKKGIAEGKEERRKSKGVYFGAICLSRGAHGGKA